MRSNFAFVFVLLDVASASFVENPDDDRPKLFVDATGIITKEFIADYIEILNSEELSALKDMSKTTDLAMLNEKLTTYNANLIQRVVDEMMYVKFNSMNQAQQLAAIEELSAADLAILKDKFEISAPATTAEVTAKLNAYSSEYVTDNSKYLLIFNSDFNPKNLLFEKNSPMNLPKQGPVQRMSPKIYSRKQIAFIIYLMDIESYIIVKEITGTSDSAALETYLFAMNIEDFLELMQQVQYIRFNSLTPNEQVTAIEKLSSEDLNKLKEQLKLSESATIPDVIAVLQVKAKEKKIVQKRASGQSVISTSNSYVIILSLLQMLMCDL